MNGLKMVNPESLGAPKGYTNGVIAPAGSRLLFVAGQVAWTEDHRILSGDFVRQFERALANVITVVRAAGGEPTSIVRMTVYVKEKRSYLGAQRSVGEAYRRQMGRHYPAMTLVTISDLVEEGAVVEIEATAALPPE